MSERICCSDCQEFVSDDGDTRSQSNKREKFISYTKGLHVFFDRMFHRGDLNPDPNVISSYEKITLESIRNWETVKGKRAVLCGVTYNKQKYKLKGTSYDVINMRELLISRFGFPISSIHILAGILNPSTRIQVTCGIQVAIFYL